METDLGGHAVTDKPDIQDWNVEPPGYKPPASAEELLARYAAGERFFDRTLIDGPIPVVDALLF